MRRIINLVKRRPGMSEEDFREHYEGKHAFLGPKHLEGVLADFKRHYVGPVRRYPADGDWSKLYEDDRSAPRWREQPFDAISVYSFVDKQAEAEFRRIMSDPAIARSFLEDEQRFIDRDQSLQGFCEVVEGGGMVSR